MTPGPEIADDERFMHRALALAAEAARLGEVPVGAVAVIGNEVVGEGFNRREIDHDPLAHAELLALKAASVHLQAWRLGDVTLYVTLEPCPMCAGAMVNARIGRVVFGASDPKAGAVGSLFNLVQDTRLNHRLEVTSGVLREACAQLLVDFFKTLRRRGTKTE